MAFIVKLMLLLDVWITLHAQEVFMNYKKSCFGSENSEDSYDSSVDGIFPVGCTVQLKCQYYDCMAKGNNTFLYIEISNAELNRSVNVLARSGCDVEVLITDVTMDFDDVRVVCKDLLHPQAYRTRSLTIGYPPVEPENLTLIHSSNFLRLTFDKVKTGRELNDEFTQWTISYLWSEDKCSCSSVEEDSRIVTCTINLQNAVDDGFHSGCCLSNLYKPILFIINAENKFGKMEISKSFSLLDYMPVPEVAPEMCVGCFSDLPCDTEDCRHVIVYWQPIPQTLHDDFVVSSYDLHVLDGDQVVNSYRPGGADTSRFLRLSASRAYTVQLFVVTLLGARSSKYSTVHLTPLKDKSYHVCAEPAAPPSFLVETDKITSSLGTRKLYFRWSHDNKTVINYRVFWCRGSKLNFKCNNNDYIRSQTLPPSSTSYTLSLADDPDSFLVGLSRQVKQPDGGIASSGIQWYRPTYQRHASFSRHHG